MARARDTGSPLNATGYAELAKPSKSVPVTLYRWVTPQLFERIIDQTSGVEETNVGGDWCPPAQ